jgi:AmmeMemoRadiSam system protein A
MPVVSPTVRVALLALARESVSRALDGRAPPEIGPEFAAVSTPRAAFVTIRRRDTGELRGCRGECPARRPLAECVRGVAVAAALADPRFVPVTREELPDLHFEISALTDPVPIRPEEVRVGRHGLILAADGTIGLLLPQVPVEQGWDTEAFLDALSHKAGLARGRWRRPGAALRAFEAEVWSDGAGPKAAVSDSRGNPQEAC